MILEESCLSRIPLFLYIGALFYERITTSTGHIAWIFNYNICRIDTACTADRNTKRAATPYIDALFTATTSVLCDGV